MVVWEFFYIFAELLIKRKEIIMRASRLNKILNEYREEEINDIERYERFKELISQFDSKHITRRIMKVVPEFSNYSVNELSINRIKVTFEGKVFEVVHTDVDKFRKDMTDGLNTVYSIGSHDRIKKIDEVLNDQELFNELLVLYTQYEKLLKVLKTVKTRLGYTKNPAHYKVLNFIFKGTPINVQDALSTITF